MNETAVPHWPWTGHRAQAVGNRASSAVRELHDRVAVVADTLGSGTWRDAGRPHLHVGHVGAAATRAGGAASWATAEAAADDALERESEVLREERIDHGIHSGVAVAEPEDDREDGGIDAVTAEGPDHVDGEEGQPAEDEQTDDNGQSFRRLGLHAEPLHLRLDVPLAHLPAGLRRVELVLVHHVGHRLDHLQQAVALAHAVHLGGGGAGRGTVLAIGRGVVHCVQGVRVGLRGTLQVLRGRITDRDLDFLVLVVPCAELVVALRRDRVRGPHRTRRADRGRGAVRTPVAVRRLVEVRTASPVNAQRQSLLFESISDSLRTCQ